MTQFALTLTAAILGAMAFFAFFVAPAAARAGSSTMVLSLSRAVFPRAFDVFAIASVLAAIAASLAQKPFAAAALVLATCAFLFAGWKVTPTLEKARDAARAGDYSALRVFTRSRTSAVLANLVQYIMLVLALILLVL